MSIVLTLVDPDRRGPIERELHNLRQAQPEQLAAMFAACERPLSEAVVAAYRDAFGTEAQRREFRACCLARLCCEDPVILGPGISDLRNLAPRFPHALQLHAELLVDIPSIPASGWQALWSADAVQQAHTAGLPWLNTEAIDHWGDTACRQRQAADAWLEPLCWESWQHLASVLQDASACNGEVAGTARVVAD